MKKDTQLKFHFKKIMSQLQQGQQLKYLLNNLTIIMLHRSRNMNDIIAEPLF